VQLPLYEIIPMDITSQAKEYADFITVTCLEWTPLLKDDRFKNIVMDSLYFLTERQRVTVYCFVIMNNHFHLIWQMLGDHKREAVQRDFLKYTAQQILKILVKEKSPFLAKLLVNAKDRKYQIWERNSLSIPLWSGYVIWQKLNYIHYNPVCAGLCTRPEEYKYSSAGFYYRQDSYWKFLVHCNG
jgi:REP element-mobilizing transposase RayT